MRISDWSSDVCSSDLLGRDAGRQRLGHRVPGRIEEEGDRIAVAPGRHDAVRRRDEAAVGPAVHELAAVDDDRRPHLPGLDPLAARTPDLQARLPRPRPEGRETVVAAWRYPHLSITGAGPAGRPGTPRSPPRA